MTLFHLLMPAVPAAASVGVMRLLQDSQTLSSKEFGRVFSVGIVGNTDRRVVLTCALKDSRSS
jgi:hypothetical protein